MEMDRIAQMGLDAHRVFSVITARDQEGNVVRRERIEHRNRPIMLEQLARFPKDTEVVLESSFGWGWISDTLAAAGLKPCLANSRKVAAWRKARGLAKSNRKDADLLSELPSEKQRWWEVWLASREVRDQREWLRYRMSLVAVQTRLKNQIHAILHRHGIVQDYSDLFGREGRRFLNILVAPKQQTLRDSARDTLKGYLQLLDQVRRQIAGVTRKIRSQLQRTPIGERLRSIPGIGWILAYTILAEIGEIERFRNAKHLASYSLMVPLADDSGEPLSPDEPPQGRHVGLIGRRTLKWAFIEAAHGAVRKGGRFRELYDRRTQGGKKDRNRGYIVVGRELSHVVYVCWKKERNYMENPPGRPCPKAKKLNRRKSRPGTGRPS